MVPTESVDKPSEKTYPWRPTKTDTQVYTLHSHTNTFTHPNRIKEIKKVIKLFRKSVIKWNLNVSLA